MSSSPKLWAGRFAKETDTLVHQFNASLPVDSRLWTYDIQGSIAHVKMLGECGIIPESDAIQITEGLKSIREDLSKGSVTLPSDAEDVHMAVETLLTQRLGPVAGKLHTARSRNDQVATDVRLYVKGEIGKVRQLVSALQETIIFHAEQNKEALLPGMTHLQHAQPVRLAHHLLAYFWMLDRDQGRLADTMQRTDFLPLGSGALAGTSYPINRESVAKDLGFSDVSPNSIDAVSDRDFAIETVSALSILMMHLSRLCEELILWNSPGFGWVEMGDNVTTGSSIMPQKKNPDVAELARGKTGRIYGNLMSLLTLMKGLPLAYNKDMQEDKEPIFDSFDTAKICLEALTVLLQNTKFNTDTMAQSLKGDFSTATDLADFLVRQGLPFRQAHEVVGKLVAKCMQNNKALEELTDDELSDASALFSGIDSHSLTSPLSSANSRESYGGTGKAALDTQIRLAHSKL